MVLLIFTGSMSLNVNKARAFLPIALAPVLAGGVSTQAMAHVIGGLIVAVGGGAVAVEYGDEIKQKAIELAEGSSAYLKEGFMNATDITDDWVKGTVTFSQDMINELKALSGDIGEWLANLLKTAEGTRLAIESGITYVKANSNGPTLYPSDESLYYLTFNGTPYRSLNVKNDGSLTVKTTSGTNQILMTIPVTETFSSDYIKAYNSTKKDNMLTLLGHFGIVGLVAKDAVLTAPDSTTMSNTYDDYVNGLKEVDIPLDEWLGSVTTVDGQPLSIDTTTNGLVLQDGTPYTGDITSTYDIPIVDTGTVVGAPSVPLENVLTVPTTGEGPGSGDSVGDKNINWGKLKMIGNIFTTKFPFSLPWDIGRALDAVFGQFNEQNLPQWDFKIFGETFTIKIPDMIAGWFPITRTLILIVFDISLIYSVRKLLGGAS